VHASRAPPRRASFRRVSSTAFDKTLTFDASTKRSLHREGPSLRMGMRDKLAARPEERAEHREKPAQPPDEHGRQPLKWAQRPLKWAQQPLKWAQHPLKWVEHRPERVGRPWE
jgi:hypothetical protein